MCAERNIIRIIVGLLMCLAEAGAATRSFRPGWPVPETVDFFENEPISRDGAEHYPAALST